MDTNDNVCTSTPVTGETPSTDCAVRNGVENGEEIIGEQKNTITRKRTASKSPEAEADGGIRSGQRKFARDNSDGGESHEVIMVDDDNSVNNEEAKRGNVSFFNTRSSQAKAGALDLSGRSEDVSTM